MINNKFKFYIIVSILILFIGAIFPTVVAGSLPESSDYQDPLTPFSGPVEIFTEFLIFIDYNEPMNPYVLMNYYYRDGSCVRMVYGIDATSLSPFDLELQTEVIPVLDMDNNIIGYGVKTKTNSNLFVFTKLK